MNEPRPNMRNGLQNKGQALKEKVARHARRIKELRAERAETEQLIEDLRKLRPPKK